MEHMKIAATENRPKIKLRRKLHFSISTSVQINVEIHLLVAQI